MMSTQMRTMTLVPHEPRWLPTGQILNHVTVTVTVNDMSVKDTRQHSCAAGRSYNGCMHECPLKLHAWVIAKPACQVAC
jgi:hypothetical protein